MNEVHQLHRTDDRSISNERVQGHRVAENDSQLRHRRQRHIDPRDVDRRHLYDLDLGIRRLGRRLHMADVVGRDAVEPIRVARLACERRRRGRGEGLPRDKRPAVDGDVNVVMSDLRTAGIVLAGPLRRRRSWRSSWQAGPKPGWWVRPASRVLCTRGVSIGSL